MIQSKALSNSARYRDEQIWSVVIVAWHIVFQVREQRNVPENQEPPPKPLHMISIRSPQGEEIVSGARGGGGGGQR